MNLSNVFNDFTTRVEDHLGKVVEKYFDAIMDENEKNAPILTGFTRKNQVDLSHFKKIGEREYELTFKTRSSYAQRIYYVHNVTGKLRWFEVSELNSRNKLKIFMEEEKI